MLKRHFPRLLIHCINCNKIIIINFPTRLLKNILVVDTIIKVKLIENACFPESLLLWVHKETELCCQNRNEPNQFSNQMIMKLSQVRSISQESNFSKNMSRVQKLNVWIKGQHFVRNTNCQGASLGVRMMKSGNDAENKNMFHLRVKICVFTVLG